MLFEAITAIDAGDTEKLTGMLKKSPDLVRKQVQTRVKPYDGYFGQAMLLHHVAGNPIREPLPDNIMEIVGILLDAGSDINAKTIGGPSQPTDVGWTVLGLVATSQVARESGIQQELINLLVANGATIDLDRGAAIAAALYYGENQAAHALMKHRATVDLPLAAGLGRVDLVETFFEADGSLTPGAGAMYRYPNHPTYEAKSEAEILGHALIMAAMAGKADAIKLLLDKGADVNARPEYDNQATPLHWAALRGNADVVELLLNHSADVTVRDEEYDATPEGWALFTGHTNIARLLTDSGEK